ncbi:Interferon-induced GTP-binding protein Mx1 [Purpureocillium lavendulum]|uniref:Interferon-induced GTP-binding protein Mx1 n=1 Tax=Purpureocillium lavendulum TaxID=1247861 RepID=A0AB34FG55_9HYPO|nr:Interferon-induced GTP-binding protein Mx1 [Purpureocillium lavendulum]
MSASQQRQTPAGLDRKPLDSQKFANPDEHHVKGLNAETLAKLQLPTPQWLLTPDYAPIADDSGTNPPSVFFSLNISLYNHQIEASEWADQWFFMTGRVHPFALTWELERRDGLESDEDKIDEYTIPAFVVRDHGFQAVSPRLLCSSTSAPSMMPIVSFTGPVIGAGLDCLHENIASAFDEAQLKCCGGFHTFQVFVVFPVHANPWASLCKKMVERRDSQFQPGAPFTCTGKVAGLLAHSMMRQPPTFEQDYVFIVVPDTWTFLDKAAFNHPLASKAPPTTPKRPFGNVSEYGDAMARFTSTRKRKPPASGAAPATPLSLAPASAKASIKRRSPDPTQTPSKRPRLSPTSSTIVAACETDDSVSQDSCDGIDDPGVGPPATQNAPDSASSKTSTSDPSRPQRVRQPPKKFQGPARVTEGQEHGNKPLSQKK